MSKRPYVLEVDVEGTVAYTQTIENAMKEANQGKSFPPLLQDR